MKLPAPAQGPEAPPRTTTRAAQLLILAVTAALLAVRLPGTVRHLVDTAPAQIVTEVGDPRLLRLSMTVGAVLGLTLTLVSVGVFLLVARLLEAHVTGRPLGGGRVRVGALTAVVGACFVAAQLRGLLPASFGVAGPLAGSLVAVGIGVVTAVAFARRSRRADPTARLAPLVAAAAGLALATSLTTLPG
jgi:hypothetical protein